MVVVIFGVLEFHHFELPESVALVVAMGRGLRPLVWELVARNPVESYSRWLDAAQFSRENFEPRAFRKWVDRVFEIKRLVWFRQFGLFLVKCNSSLLMAIDLFHCLLGLHRPGPPRRIREEVSAHRLRRLRGKGAIRHAFAKRR